MKNRLKLTLSLALIAIVTASANGTQADRGAIVRFQRAADSYAFEHRAIQRRVGESASREQMAAAIRDARPAAADGDLFTPDVAEAFRQRIAAATRRPGCEVTDGSSEVPRPNRDAGNAQRAPACIASALPALPPELEYRVAGVTLLLVDIHANLVVDVIHGAFPIRR